MIPRALRRISILAACACVSSTSAAAHPVPFSYLDLRLSTDGVRATLVAHVIDLAHDLNTSPPDALLRPSVTALERGRLTDLVRRHLALIADGRPLLLTVEHVEILEQRQALELRLRAPWPTTPGVIRVACTLFPYDPHHQTFLTVYEHDRLAEQAIFDQNRSRFDYFTGTRQGVMAVIKTFIPSGIRHIAIGPDHILFIVGLLLLGGRLTRLLAIVTAFTIGHSLTLSLAAVDLVNPPARAIEAAIALSIVYVGADNMLVGSNGRDVRVWIALFFGLVHGFGFAAVLKASGLPGQALGWSLFSFNLGVEIGQACIVAVVASTLTAIRRQNILLADRIVTTGSMAVIMAGTYWFVQRVFLAA